MLSQVLLSICENTYNDSNFQIMPHLIHVKVALLKEFSNRSTVLAKQNYNFADKTCFHNRR